MGEVVREAFGSRLQIEAGCATARAQETGDSGQPDVWRPPDQDFPDIDTDDAPEYPNGPGAPPFTGEDVEDAGEPHRERHGTHPWVDMFLSRRSRNLRTNSSPRHGYVDGEDWTFFTLDRYGRADRASDRGGETRRRYGVPAPPGRPATVRVQRVRVSSHFGRGTAVVGHDRVDELLVVG